MESVTDRYDRKYGQILDDRKERALDSASDERVSRLFVDPETGVSATGRTSPETDELWEANN